MQKALKNITLHKQGLSKNNYFGTGIKGCLNTIEQLAYLQIDTLSVVERAHHHTMWSRVSNYQQGYLNELIHQRKIFEHWFHAASYLPMQDYRFALPKMEAIKQGKVPYYNKVDTKTLNNVLDKIRIDGPLKAKDFKSNKTKSGTWWNWKPAKQALERLFMQGDLMISKREGMEKVYELRERVLPTHINTQSPDMLEFAEYLVNSATKAYGFTSVKHITHLRSNVPLNKAVNDILHQQVEQGLLTILTTDNMPKTYIETSLLNTHIPPSPKGVKLLSPFDNALIHRDRLEQVFDYHYRLECYVPKAKRQYGYFCLPILYKNTIVGRADCKAHRSTQLFELINLHIEKTLNDTDAFIEALVETVLSFAHFNHCNTVKLTQVKPARLAKPLRQALQAKVL